MKPAFAIHAPQLFDGDALHSDMFVCVREGKVSDIVDEKPNDCHVVMLPQGATLSPGFIDAQVNGGGGVMLNDDPTPHTIAKIGAAHRSFGTTSFLPTLISDTREKMAAAVAAVDAAIAEGQKSVVGLHLEGPFLNPARKGVHPEAHIIPARNDDVALLTSLKNGVTLVTLAPEEAPQGFVKELIAHGVVVAAGHTDGTSEEIQAVLKDGVTGFTHLYNAMSQLNARAPGAVGACLANDASFAGIIADGHHVSVEALRIAVKAKTAARLFLVSDAMASLGTKMKSFKLFDEDIFVGDGLLTTASGTLAGAQLDMASAVRFMVEKVGLSLAQALTMATSTPASFLKLDKAIGRIAPGMAANFVALDERLHVIDSWVRGDGHGPANHVG